MKEDSAKVSQFCGVQSILLTPALLVLALVLAAAQAVAAGPPEASSPGGAATNSFPEPYEILQGRAFATTFERDAFFLRRVREGYPAQWPALLGANITVKDYVLAPAKLQRFIEELGAAMEGAGDPAACSGLAAITSNPDFFANTNAYHPEILRAAASALLKLGPKGREALAGSFTETHYRQDPESLQELAGVIGDAGTSDTNLAQALARTAFGFTATNGGSYPRCTQAATTNLLRLPEGPALAARHLTAVEALDRLSRFQVIVDAAAQTRATALVTNLLMLEKEATAKLTILTNTPGPYRDQLREFDNRLKSAVARLQAPPPAPPSPP